MQSEFEKGTFLGDEMLSCRTVYKGSGFSDADFARPVIGICNSFTDIVPGHKNLREVAEQVKFGVYRAGGTPVEFGCIAVCDGICTTHDGSRYSLPSREVVADGIEIMARAHKLDGLVLIGSCDKTVPGMLMAAARLDIPTIFVAGGCMLGGPSFGSKRKADATCSQEALGMYQAGKISYQDVLDISDSCVPTIGSCQHMATANSMCCLAEAMGLSITGSAAIPAVYNERMRVAFRSGETIVNLVHHGITARDILNEHAIRNGLMLMMATGGSTNCLLHIVAIGHELGIVATEIMAWAEQYGQSIPLIARINPASSEYDAEDFYQAGGVPAVLQSLLTRLYRDNLTVTGKTLDENVKNYRSLYPRNPNVITSLEHPFSQLAGLAVLHGNLCPDTAVAKPAAINENSRCFTGTAICFDGENAANEAIGNRLVKPGHVVVIRYAGPKGAPGMPEMFKPMKLLYGQGLHETTALITDGRFSGTNNGCFVGHISPEAAEGGPIALVKDGDVITIDVINRTLTLQVSPEELLERSKKIIQKTPDIPQGYLERYAKQVTSANKGGVLK